MSWRVKVEGSSSASQASDRCALKAGWHDSPSQSQKIPGLAQIHSLCHAVRASHSTSFASLEPKRVSKRDTVCGKRTPLSKAVARRAQGYSLTTCCPQKTSSGSSFGCAFFHFARSSRKAFFLSLVLSGCVLCGKKCLIASGHPAMRWCNSLASCTKRCSGDRRGGAAFGTGVVGAMLLGRLASSSRKFSPTRSNARLDSTSDGVQHFPESSNRQNPTRGGPERCGGGCGAHKGGKIVPRRSKSPSRNCFPRAFKRASHLAIKCGSLTFSPKSAPAVGHRHLQMLVALGLQETLWYSLAGAARHGAHR